MYISWFFVVKIRLSDILKLTKKLNDQVSDQVLSCATFGMTTKEFFHLPDVNNPVMVEKGKFNAVP